MTPIRIAAVLFFSVLQFACSRPSDSADAAAGKISEKQALTLLMSALKEHKVEGLDCLGFMSENDGPADAKAELWEFAAHEIHNERCGGDPGVSPVRDRYKINSARKVWVYSGADADYNPL